MINRALLVITHGNFGIEIVKSAEMIMGPQEDVTALALKPGESVDDLRGEAVKVVEANTEKGMETIVLCDLLGGSPSNVGLYLLSRGVKHIFTGLSLPMLIEMLQFYKLEEDIESLLSSVKQTAIDGVHILDIDFMKKKS
ncbi:PTS sugar transporter subunit IIA [Breznakia pachnodae]|uniref:PTS system mannose-specific IIA component n=1 Tax=Breznakia pachnodae TaxID=265178 RepID=A0ABU0DZA6_9FIRM|nr:PTS mannose transporter subunit IIAB [Breznakia pachnodae]MDQ0359880.1 PTS system mannose-specific IIA component [Breznakia pachnodae]